MPFAMTNDGVKLHYEETGSGTPLIFVHEFAGDHRSWDDQMRHFGRSYRAISYGARGYPPSDVPPDPASYSQARAADDILAVLDHLGIEQAHVCGLSMGGFATLHFGFRHRGPHPARSALPGAATARSRTPATSSRAEADTVAAALRRKGHGSGGGARYAYGPTRVQFEAKDPRGFADLQGSNWPNIPPSAPPTPSLACQRERPSLL